MRNDIVVMNNELGRIWQKALVAHFKILSQHLPGGIEENHEKPIRIITLHLRFETVTCQIKSRCSKYCTVTFGTNLYCSFSLDTLHYFWAANSHLLHERESLELWLSTLEDLLVRRLSS
jgi:hypothetical protein